mgnify:CR=1 FL=1
MVMKNIAPVRRGDIVDTNGKVIAGSRNIYNIYVDLSHIPKDGRSGFLLSLMEKYDINIDIQSYNNENYYTISEQCTWEELRKYICISNVVPEMCIIQNTIRHYKYGCEFAHIIGYTSRDSEDQRCTMLPNARVGVSGLEKVYDHHLFGMSGLKTIEVNSLRQFVRDIDVIDAVDGKQLEITIDYNVQVEAYKLLSRYRSAACVVLDVETGAVLCYISYPSYDTNIYMKAKNGNEIANLYKREFNPVYDKVSKGLYSPGSTFKMVVALAALKYGLIDFSSIFNCSGCVVVGDTQFNCWNSAGHKDMNLSQAISQSCNSYFYNLGQILSVDQIHNVALDFCLGDSTGIDLIGEKRGLICYYDNSDRSSKKFTKGDVVNMAIGQGYILCTPLQLACMTATIANGKYRIRPYINKSLKESMMTQRKRLNYRSEHIDYIQNAMMGVVNGPYGTARNIKLDHDFIISGKTGTAQVRKRIKNTNEIVPYEFRDHALFVGFAPLENPKYAICVVVEHGESGGRVAAPLARDILLLCKKYIGSSGDDEKKSKPTNELDNCSQQEENEVGNN